MPDQVANQKKGLHPMAWVGMGCGGLLVVAILAIAVLVGWGKRKIKEVQESLVIGVEQNATETLIDMHPELEMLSEDPATGEVTVLVNATGELLTFSPEELTQGRVSIKGADGTSTTLGLGELADVPGWVPRHPGAVDEKALFHRESGSSVKGLVSYDSTESADDLENFYDGELSAFSTVGSSTFTIGEVEQKTLTYEEGKKQLEVILVRAAAGEPFEVTVTYRDDWPEGAGPAE